jgi:hypothetical protein
MKGAVKTTTRLWTFEDLVYAPRVSPGLASVATLGQASITRKLAPIFKA